MDAFLMLFMLMLIVFSALAALVIDMVIIVKMFVKIVKEEMDRMHWNRK